LCAPAAAAAARRDHRRAAGLALHARARGVPLQLQVDPTRCVGIDVKIIKY
jgi:hypothetical protein